MNDSRSGRRIAGMIRGVAWIFTRVGGRMSLTRAERLSQLIGLGSTDNLSPGSSRIGDSRREDLSDVKMFQMKMWPMCTHLFFTLNRLQPISLA